MVTLGLFSLMGLYDRNTSPATVAQTTLETVVMAEDLGFDIAWFAEHHFTNHSICPSGLMMVARAAGVTKHIRLGPAVLVTPFHSPLRLVQEVAFADVLSDGRLVIGLGSGYQPYEFSRFGVDSTLKHKIMLETWDVLEQGLASGVVKYDGEILKIKETELPMRPVGLGLPEFFIAGFEPSVVARAARQNYTPFMSFGHRGIMEALSSRDLIKSQWEPVRGKDKMPLAVQRYIYVTDNRQDALHAAECVRNLARANKSLTAELPKKEGAFLRLMPFHDEPPLDDFLDQAIIGSADHCAEKLASEIAALDVTHLSCFMGFAGIGRRETLASIERFGTEVLPQLGSVISYRGNMGTV